MSLGSTGNFTFALGATYRRPPLVLPSIKGYQQADYGCARLRVWA